MKKNNGTGVNQMQSLWEARFAQRTHRMKSSAIRELLKLTEDPEIISFAGGLPAPEVFPVEDFNAACDRVLRNQGAQALQYGTTEGYTPLRELIAERASRQGIKVTADNVLITSGSQQALDLLGKIFINEGDRVLVENPTYLGALQAWNIYGADYTTVGLDENGLITDELEPAMRTGPKFMYVLPNFQNPSGVTLSHERRLQLIKIADHYGVPIVEDDPYGELRFEAESIPSVETLDSQVHHNGGCLTGNVIYLSTFSKTLAPGIRLAWVIAPPEVIQKLVMAKQGADLHTSTFTQIVAYEVAKNNFLDRHIELIRRVYRERRNVMLESLEENMPDGVQWTHPKGGLFLWLTLPTIMNSVDLFREAVKQKVAFVPGESFYACGGGENTMRLNFSNATPERINEGISRLGVSIKHRLIEK
jgi:2-aminoadipate transaminase